MTETIPMATIADPPLASAMVAKPHLVHIPCQLASTFGKCRKWLHEKKIEFRDQIFVAGIARYKTLHLLAFTVY